ncbi:MAG: iron-sulfur cluster assembly protein IscA [Candidatus Dasytiphilus stammeri]
MSITLTTSAVRQIRYLLTKRGKGFGIRLGVRTSGCTGLAYVMEFVDDELKANDILVVDEPDIKIIINKKDFLYLNGTELDFTREGLNEGFKFNNPNAKDKCGCGKSFRI